MKGDLIYCYHCKDVSKDNMRMYKQYKVQDTMLEDSRVNDKYKNMCPFCLSCDTMNASKILIEGDKIKKNSGGLGNWYKCSLYYRLKKLVKSKGLYKSDDK